MSQRPQRPRKMRTHSRSDQKRMAYLTMVEAAASGITGFLGEKEH